MLYSTTRIDTSPCVQKRMARLAIPITTMPFCLTSRADRSRKWRGTHESDGHVRQHRRAVQKAGLCAPTSNRPASRASTTASNACRANAEPSPEMVDHAAEDHRVKRLALHRLRMPQHVEQDDAARRERERRRHVEHRHLAVRHARLGQHVDVVRHSFEARVSAAAQRKRAHEQGHDHEWPH